MTDRLVIVGHPKGFTTPTYQIVKQATGLRPDPDTPNNGEILNRYQKPAAGPIPWFATGEHEYRIAKRILDAVPDGMVAKDVVQPWLISRYLRENGRFRVLAIRRPVEEVARLRKSTPLEGPIPLLEDLFPQATFVEYRDLICEPEVLWDALRTLGYDVAPFDYRTGVFREKREKTLRKLGIPDTMTHAITGGQRCRDRTTARSGTEIRSRSPDGHSSAVRQRHADGGAPRVAVRSSRSSTGAG